MTGGGWVAAFVAVLAVIFAAAVIAGSAIDPPAGAGAPAHDAAPAHGGATAAQRDELRLAAGDTTLTAGRPSRLDFAILDERGERLRDFEVEQSRRMHLIVVRRDLRGFQHLHPREVATGAWTVTLTLPDAGVYHAFADFQTGGTRRTLGTDLFAAGGFEPLALPAPSNVAATDGYDVRLRDDGGRLRFTVRRGGRTIAALQPYLGARGHLVMLRAGDLAYEHAHPLGDQLAFGVGDAAPGTYRLFLQFRHADRVHTAAFTHEVAR
ncbi:MAG TPA: hypothetical protein VNA28_12780 [Solirubrobacteraceae bacterium]|nr:hypothetical protein [Solirubrobacteraceae bacterium]